jgi:hypothetical protein
MVTSRMLPWIGTLFTLGACGGVADLQGAGGAPRLENNEQESTPGKGVSDPKPFVANGSGGMSSTVGGASSGGGAATMGSDVGGSPPNQYSGRGFVVHEWGTDTIVVGSDGSLQRGLHHEEEDLPAFVYDRIKAATLLGVAPSPSVTIKMETPVTYFYSDVPRTVRAAVSFPKGVLTQWYPAVTSFLPPIAAPTAMSPSSQLLGYADPVLDPTFPFASDLCRTKFGTVGSGLLDWGSVSVLARDANVAAQLPLAALDEFSWSYARDVAANPVQIANGETERFLFYRGLGNFELPLQIKVTGPGIGELGGNPIVLKNGLSEAIGPVFMMNVAKDEAIFSQFSGGIAPGGELSVSLPALYGTSPLDTYSDRLSEAVTGALDDTGLYHDEAVAMVNTWKRQWFRTPGQRLLYIIPQTWTDASIPLTIEPKPDTMLRVMLIRVELITPEQEAEDVAALAGLAGKSSESVDHFLSLGRFAEPRLRRALALSPSDAGQDLLAQIATANTSVSSGE